MKAHALILPAGLLVLAISCTRSIQAKVNNTSATKWQKVVLTDKFLTEGLAAGDLDGDGVKDLVAGAFWFKGPDFSEAKPYRPGRAAPIDAYMEDSFLSWIEDMDGDGRNDILMASHPGKDFTVYLNPGDKDGDWPAHRVMSEAANESPLWTDVDGDGKNELVCMQGGKYGYAEVDWSDVTKPWTFIAISDSRTNSPYMHGLGAGDLNGDGRVDILCKDGWFEQPAEKKDGELWKWHPHVFAGPGGAQMPVYDVDGDGDMDVVTALHGHGYGLVWYENRRNAAGEVEFTRHVILPESGAETGPDGVQFSQLHALDAGDFDGDGRIDIATGKRFWAHNGGDEGARDPALAVVFYNRAGEDGKGVRWVPEVIDADSGVGCQVLAVDLDGDGKLEFAAGTKKGVHVIRQRGGK